MPSSVCAQLAKYRGRHQENTRPLQAGVHSQQALYRCAMRTTAVPACAGSNGFDCTQADGSQLVQGRPACRQRSCRLRQRDFGSVPKSMRGLRHLVGEQGGGDGGGQRLVVQEH